MRPLAGVLLAVLIGCNGDGDGVAPGNANAAAADGRPFRVQEVASFRQPWAMTFIPGGSEALITEKSGRLLLLREGGRSVEVTGVPEVDYGGQGGLGDVVLHPAFASNNLVYLSWVEAGTGGDRGAVVGRGRLVREGETARIEGLHVIWRQEPKVEGRGHYSHRLAFSPGGHLFITSGERQKFTPSQDMNQNLGKVVRLTDAGGVPSDNPFYDRGRIASQIWTLGHRNLLGIAFDGSGQLWTHEMGPQGGDEFNRIERGANYGYPIVSNGSHYDGRDIPDHAKRPEFNAPEVTWNGLSPAGLMIYSGSLFPQWRGNAFVGGLSGEALVRVEIDGTNAREAQRWSMGKRIREIEQGPDGAIYLLEDGSGGRLLRLTPAG
jgi:glucose/arabinose dehydrogenase